ncbi:MAG: MoxR family ATPase [Phycisphaeraceae bacterium]|nr:MoxR family ATPase [Phycisphaeraceae bacterium]
MTELNEVGGFAGRLREALGRAVFGQSAVIEQVLTATLAHGHVLLEGPPGTAKTLLARSLAILVGGRFSRVQFTPDLMPSDLTGLSILSPGEQQLVFRPGPVFSDMLLADEINRAPAKTQSALLEAMQERQVSVDGQVHALPEALMVFATQNPVEFEGTYPLPEAQLDRFLMKIVVGYPDEEAENAMLDQVHRGFDSSRESTWNLDRLGSVEELQQVRRAIVEKVTVSPAVLGYIASLVRATRQSPRLLLGASPRASTMLLQASKAMAALRERDFVTPDDVRDLVAPVLRHRVLLSPETEIEGIAADRCLEEVVRRVPVPRQ